MAKYPVRLSVSRYQGSKPNLKQKNIEEMRIAKIIGEYLNNKVEHSEAKRQDFSYPVIARALNLNEATVRDIGIRNGEGSNGITVERD
jgi:hypothetical protein